MWVVGEERTFALVQCFVKWKGQLFLVIKKLLEHGEQTEGASPHIVQVHSSAHLNVVPAPCNMTKCLTVLDFVCISPNSFEMNL